MNWSGFSGGPPRYSGTGALTLLKEAENPGLAEPGVEMAFGVPTSSSPPPLGGPLRRWRQYFHSRTHQEDEIYRAEINLSNLV